jgi:hypothetical protein
MKLLILLTLLASCGNKPTTTIYKNLSCPELETDITLKPNEIRIIYDGVYEYFLNGEHIMVSGNCVLKTLEK